MSRKTSQTLKKLSVIKEYFKNLYFISLKKLKNG